MRINRLVVTAIVTAGAAVSLAGQQTPVFRSQTNYVELDAVATDEHGAFVTGLSAADFELKEDSHAQPIATFSFVNLPTDSAAASAAPPAAVRSDLNLGAPSLTGRIYLLVLGGQFLKGDASLLSARQARQFINDFLLPGDVAGVWTAGITRDALRFTSDRAALLAALDVQPAGPQYLAGSDASRLKAAVEWFSGIQGRRKSLLFFTPGTLGVEGGFFEGFFDFERWMSAKPRFEMGTGVPLTPAEVTGRADVHVYPIDVRGLVALAPVTPVNATGEQAARAVEELYWSQSNDLWTMRTLAIDTGGRAIVNTNDFREGFATIVGDNSRYYVLGYYSPNKARDGRFVSVSVKSRRPGVTLQTRRGYIAQ